MQIKCSLDLDRPTNARFRAVKIFSVILLSPLDNENSRTLSVFIAILGTWTDTSSSRSMTLSVTLDGNAPQTIEDVSHFFHEDAILAEWWGKGTKLAINAGQLCNYAAIGNTQLGDGVFEYCKSKGVHSLLVVPGSTPSHRKFLVVAPVEASKGQAGKAQCTFQLPNTDSSFHVAAGFWSCHKFSVPAQHTEDFQLEHDIEFGEIDGIDELRLYYALPKTADIDRHGGAVSARSSHTQSSPDSEHPLELYQVLKRGTYFKEWIDAGLGQAKLLRLHNGPAVTRMCSEQHVASLRVTVEATDRAVLAKRERRRQIAYMLLAAAVGLGTDMDRLDILATKLLPASRFVSGTFWWLVLCAACVPAAFPRQFPKCKRVSKALHFLILALVGTWCVFAFAAHPDAYDIAVASLIRYTPCAVIPLSLLAMLAQRYDLEDLKSLLRTRK